MGLEILWAPCAAADVGCALDRQIGDIVALKLCVVASNSDAIQRRAKKNDSKVIVAIEKDEAAVCRVGAYGLVGDLFTIVPELSKALAKSG